MIFNQNIFSVKMLQKLKKIVLNWNFGIYHLHYGWRHFLVFYSQCAWVGSTIFFFLLCVERQYVIHAICLLFRNSSYWMPSFIWGSHRLNLWSDTLKGFGSIYFFLEWLFLSIFCPGASYLQSKRNFIVARYSQLRGINKPCGLISI